ncbi:MAG: N-acetyltransferase [Anaerohalosphaeraceae bacterium]|nr:N-acetyltransferase [Anaerohalosphaeraceae bacterium]
MNIRNAKIRDTDTIHSLIGFYAQLDRMLFRSKAHIYENLQMFKVAEIDEKVIGCCALQVVWKDLAEIKSIAVAETHKNRGVGKTLVKAAIEDARQLGVEKVFALTLEPEFFEKIGFAKIDKQQLPMKVWSDCAKCNKQDHCDETAVEMLL